MATDKDYNDYFYKGFNIETVRGEDGLFRSKIYTQSMDHDMPSLATLHEAENAAGAWIDSLPVYKGDEDHDYDGFHGDDQDDFEDSGMSHSEQCSSDRNDYARQFSCPIQRAEIRAGA